MSERYSVPVYIYSKLLEREDVEEFINLARSDFSEDHGFEIQIEHENVDLRVSTLDELVSHSKVPDRLSNIRIDIWEPKTYPSVFHIRRGIHFSLDTFGSYLNVDGLEETWVEGVSKKLQRLFDHKRPRFFRFRNLFRHRIVMSAASGIILVLNIQSVLRLPFVQSLLFATASIYLFLGYTNWSVWAFTTEVSIQLRSPRRLYLGMELKDALPILVSLLVLLAMIVQIAITFQR